MKIQQEYSQILQDSQNLRRFSFVPRYMVCEMLWQLASTLIEVSAMVPTFILIDMMKQCARDMIKKTGAL